MIRRVYQNYRHFGATCAERAVIRTGGTGSHRKVLIHQTEFKERSSYSQLSSSSLLPTQLFQAR